MMGAAGAGGAAAGAYVEDVFGTFLYTGNGSTQTITNGIDLSGKGGLVWIKGRSVAYNNVLNDTGRGVTQQLSSNQTDGQQVYTTGLTAFTSTGFSIGNNIQYNESSQTYASWTFRECPGFFDVVTYTGNGSNRTIAHSLGSVPGTIIVKRTNAVADWQVYHRSLANTEYLVLNSTAAKATGATRWNSTTPTSTEFSLGTDTTVNANGGTYVAYLFAHDAQLFGDGGNQSVIKCGSYTGGSGVTQTIDLGWEPQWVLIKPVTNTGNWSIFDCMRGLPVGASDALLRANLSDAEVVSTGVNRIDITPTGFQALDHLADTNATGTYIYIAIRRGPMKTPTDATKVFGLTLSSGDVSIGPVQTSDASTPWSRIQDVDMVLGAKVSGDSKNFQVSDLLRGFQSSASQLLSTATTPTLTTSSTGPETASGNFFFRRVGLPGYPDFIQGGSSSANWSAYRFKRAPGFFDVVAYTGTGSAGQTISHNLGVLPELLILKARVDDSGQSNGLWGVAAVNAPEARRGLYLNSTSAGGLIASALGSGFSSSTTTFNAPSYFVSSAKTYIAYLFASCPGISKVGSYTGTGTTLSIDCGFTNGARFVLIKRTDSTGDWYVWDTARGIVSGNDPFLLLNSTAAENTSTDYIDPLNSGFQISSTAPAAINANGGSFIYLAIA